MEQTLEKLQFLSNYSLGMQAYYVKLLQDEELVLRVAAATTLLNQQGLPIAFWPAILPLAKYGAVRNRAVNFLVQLAEYDLVEEILAQPIFADRQALLDGYNREQISAGTGNSASLARELFLADGAFEWLAKSLESMESSGGWRSAIEGQIIYILALPTDPAGPFSLLDTLANANEFGLMEKVVGIFRQARVYPMECAVFQAKSEIKKGRYREALSILPKDPRGILSESLLAAYWDTRAMGLRKLTEFQEAFRCYQEKNQVGVAKHIQAERFYQQINSMVAFRFESGGQSDVHSDVIMMLGFPRSGTTLLENALAAHPSIETYEEIPSFKAVEHYLLRLGRVDVSVQEMAGARAAYYGILARFRRNQRATVFVDKMPIRSANARLLCQLLPEQKYIFSIRHPHDVVLSCFFQSFTPNTAMENLRTFAGACRLYDFTMSQWFSHFSLESPQVHYVRYEALVQKFEETVTAACDFLGVGWDPQVLQFADKAQQRAMRTPSYQKVRAGVSIGVQTYWRDFGFLFERPEAKCLERWVKHFGYAS